jgi:predicted alpha/beta-fold hydrolase
MASLADDRQPYRAPAWLPGGHVQTIYASLRSHAAPVRYRRTRWDTPDGDFIDLDWADGPPDDRHRPLLAVFHGLEGSSRSHYALALMDFAQRRGLRGVVVHFRGCSGELNAQPRAYHSGDSAEIDWVLRRLRAEVPASPLHAAGVSLGGNALLKWLGEQGPGAGEVLASAAAISAPLDLMATGDALGEGLNMIYTRMFLASMKRKILAKLERFPGIVDAAAVVRSRTLREFDGLVTAPLHGFRDTDDYWTRASAKPWLGRITVPTLVLNARNDPFLPAGALPSPAEVAAAVTLEYPESGGHVGFLSPPFPGSQGWLPGRILGFLRGAAGHDRNAATQTDD